MTETNAEYHASRAISASGLKLIKQSPLHYWARYLDPNREPDQPTPVMKLGTAVHTALLEPHLFDKQYVVLPEGIDKRSKDGKALFAEIEVSGVEPLKPEQMQQIRRTQEAAFSHPMIRILLSRPERMIEKSMYWTDEETGVLCKMRPDFMLPPGLDRFPHGYVMDLKTTADANPLEFPRQVWNLEMLIQAAWYTDGYMQIFKTELPPPFVWFAQEKESPFANKPYRATTAQIEYGRREYRRLLTIYAECAASNKWPSYGTEIADLELPSWAEKIITATEADEVVGIEYAPE